MSKIYEAVKKAAQERERLNEPAVPQPLVGDGPKPAAAVDEDYQKLRASVVSIPMPSGLHTILLASPSHGEGTTTVAIGLAVSLAKERDARVLLVEGNFRSPSFRGLFPLSNANGLRDFAAGRVTPEALAVRLEQQNLSVIAAGPPSETAPVEMVEVLIARLQPQFDFILIDGPPVNSYADSSVLSTKVDGVILVVEADRTPVSEAEAAKRQLDRVGARILGVVLNRRRSYIPAFIESVL